MPEEREKNAGWGAPVSQAQKRRGFPRLHFALSLHAVLKPAFPCCHLPDDPWPNSLSGSTIRCAWTHHTCKRFRHNTDNCLTLWGDKNFNCYISITCEFTAEQNPIKRT